MTLKVRNTVKRVNSTADSYIDELISEAETDAVSLLHTALMGVQSTFRDMQGFWEQHIVFLSLLLQGQTDLPSGEESRMLWTKYQADLLHSSSSIAESADALSINPPSKIV